MKIHMTKEEIDDAQILREPLRRMTFGEYLREMLTSWKCIIIGILVLSLVALGCYLAFPPADAYVVFISGSFKTDASFEKDISSALSRYVPDLNGDEAYKVKTYFFFHDPANTVQTAEAKKLYKLLESGKRVLFMADGANIDWLDKNRYLARDEDGLRVAIPCNMTDFTVDVPAPFAFMNNGDSYATLLPRLSFALPSGAVLSGENRDGKAGLKQYRGALGLFKGLNPRDAALRSFADARIREVTLAINTY